MADFKKIQQNNHYLQICEKTGLTHDYLGMEFSARLIRLMPANFELFREERLRKVRKYEERYDKDEFPEYFMPETEPKIKELDALVDKVNELIDEAKTIKEIDNKEELVRSIKDIYSLVCKCNAYDRLFNKFKI
ncbi:hypothetical protein J4409_01235 [Candidatus Woesearchaeota archaeon]|nr:hypothetical protein [Candidatus Woesearchaeota archaeon]